VPDQQRNEQRLGEHRLQGTPVEDREHYHHEDAGGPGHRTFDARPADPFVHDTENQGRHDDRELPEPDGRPGEDPRQTRPVLAGQIDREQGTQRHEVLHLETEGRPPVVARHDVEEHAGREGRRGGAGHVLDEEPGRERHGDRRHGREEHAQRMRDERIPTGQPRQKPGDLVGERGLDLPDIYVQSAPAREIPTGVLEDDRVPGGWSQAGPEIADHAPDCQRLARHGDREHRQGPARPVPGIDRLIQPFEAAWEARDEPSGRRPLLLETGHGRHCGSKGDR